MSDFDWTDHGTAEDHADRLEELSMQAGEEGWFNKSETLHVAANCIRYLSAKAEVLEKENEAAEKGIEALREAGREVLGSLAPLRLGGMPLDSRMYEAVSRLETLLAAHDRGEK